MAISHQISVEAHPGIYDPKLRKMDVFYSIPENGIDNNTGVLLLISGFSANAHSKVYQKMRNRFADKYNLLTVQCNYFGWEFMQGENLLPNLVLDSIEQFQYCSAEDYLIVWNNFNQIEKLVPIAKKYNKKIELKAEIMESWSYFNDMGIMQAIDNITAVFYVMNLLKKEGFSLNPMRCVVYGHSHGGYLAHLCNLFAPNFFSLLLDNSGWVIPAYLRHERILKYENYQIIFRYLVHDLVQDTECYNLQYLYAQMSNRCRIIAFHGINDRLVDFSTKKTMINRIPHALFYPVYSEDIWEDGAFRSTGHGLDADFIKVFEAVMDNYQFPPKEGMLPKKVQYQTKMARYEVSYESGLPQLSVQFMEK